MNAPGFFVVILFLKQMDVKLSRESLAGQTILITRPHQQREPLYSLVKNAGAKVLLQPTIEIRALKSFTALDETLHRAGEFRWIVFSSGNGVRFFLERFLALHNSNADSRSRDFLADRFSETHFITPGPGTATVLQEYGLNRVRFPEEHTAEGVVALLRPLVREEQRILLVRASRGRDVMKRSLSLSFPKPGAVEEVVAYESRDVKEPDPSVLAAMENGEIDWTTCTSSAIATSLVNLFGAALKKTKLASISAITSETLRRLGYEIALESETATIPGLFEALRKFG